MEKFNFVHSLKNIPIPGKDQYLKQLIGKTEEFIDRLRWKAFFYLNPQAKHRERPTYGFKTAKTAPQVKELNDFENDLYNTIANVKFSEHRSGFQSKLAKDVKNIKNSDKIFLLADKTTNIYEVSADDYKKLLLDNVTKDYRQTTHTAIDNIDSEALTIASKLELEDRIERLADDKAFITIKDHKDNFINNPKCRLINPAKSQIGKISKQILDPINSELRETLGLQQWQSTQQVLDWLSNLNNKNNLRFLQLDICEFYPSISADLLSSALDFANRYLKTPLSQDKIEIIMHSRKSFLFTRDPTDPDNKSVPWIKKNGLFDVTMGAPDGAEICELVGLFLLDKVRTDFPDLSFGLYRDDGLAVHRRIP